MAITETLEQVTIELPADVKTALERKAKGQDIKIFIQSIVIKQAMRPSLDEVLAPVRLEFDESGMGEVELDDFMNSIREQAFHERTKK